MFHVLFYVRPLAFPPWAIRAIRIFRTFRFFRIFRIFQVFRAFQVIWFFRVIRTMLLATMYMA